MLSDLTGFFLSLRRRAHSTLFTFPQAPGAHSVRLATRYALRATCAAQSRRPGRLAAREQIPTPCRATLLSRTRPFGRARPRTMVRFTAAARRATMLRLGWNPEGDIVASKRQIEANRRNARKSTGPKTAAGKAASAEAANAQSDTAAVSQPVPADENYVLRNEANPAHTADAAPSRGANPPGRRVGETPWYDHEERVPQNEPNSAQPTEKKDDPPPPCRSRGRPRPSSEGCFSFPSGAGGLDSIHFPQAPGARSARLATRFARGAVAPSGPLCGPGANSRGLTRAAGAAYGLPDRRSGARDCAPRRMARRQASGASARR